MKRALLFSKLIILSIYSFGQQWSGSPDIMNQIYRDGEIISAKGGPASSSRTIFGSLWGNPDLGWSHGYIGFNASRTTYNASTPWQINGNGAKNGSSAIFGNIDGDMLFSSRSSSGSGAETLSDIQIWSGIKMRLNSDGKLIVGDAKGWGSTMTWPGNYKLFVQSGILTEKVKVAVLNSSEWADHVFHNNYKLIPLKSLETFVLTYKHLPGIPSASEVVKEGLDLGKMDATLLEKIEELTLYIIELNKKLEKQQQKINALKSNN